MTKKRSKKRGTQAELIRQLMNATGLSDEACRINLLNRTVPRNPLVAKAWEKALADSEQVAR